MKEKGILLPIFSLPSKYGIGDFGYEAYQFINILSENNIKYWEVLPINECDKHPYSPISYYALEEDYISLDKLKEQGLIQKAETRENKGRAVYDNFKQKYYEEAFKNFKPDSEYEEFIKLKEMNEYAEFSSERSNYNKEYYLFLQYIAYKQWMELKQYANSKGIEIIGDMPVYPVFESVETQYNPECFEMENGKFTFESGTPPDYFNENGQKWNSPVYNVESIKKDIIVEKFKSILNIDTNLKNAKFDKYGINISGWRLANEKNSIKVLIDNKEIDDKYISYSYKYDLISIVKGYGTYEENSTPMFDINIPTIDITNGEHQIEIQVELENGTIVKKVKNKIIIDKSIKHILNIDTDINGLVFNELKKIQISGWKLATEKGTKLVVYIDNKKIDDSHIKNSRTYDLISIVKGYGTYEENPTPMFEVNISTENISKQNHNIKIQYLAEDGSILDNVEFVAIYGDKYRGIDVSQKNGIVNWRQVANSGIDFAMIRIGYRGYRGATLVLDDQAIYNLREAKSFGIKVGVYFVTQAINLSEAQEEALWVAGQLNKNGIKLEYPVAIDVEDSGARKNGYLPGRADLLDSETRTMLTRAFCDVIKYQGFIPAVYTSKNWFNTHLNYAELTNYDIWVAHYTYDENKQTDFDKNYQVWQYTDKGSILGVSGNVDKNICYKRY